jgi:NAD(P)H-dependent flavin oxidoreductase YrpB (nitropropane dioxygenase family)
MKELNIGGLISKVPIIQGGMAVGISKNRLASAVANAGGIGVIATAGIGHLANDVYSNFIEANNRVFTEEIRKAKSLTKGIIGVNIMAALSNYASLAKVAIKEKADIIFSGAGLPLSLPSLLPEGNVTTKLVPIVSSAKALILIARRWVGKFNYVPDAVVIEGPLAGGHLGFKKEDIFNEEYSLEKLVPDVVAQAKDLEDKHGKPVPVIAAGGIYSGADTHKFIKRGASGVQMATRFVATHECDASEEIKNAFVNAKKENIVIIESPVGMPGRAIRNQFLDDVACGHKKPFKCPFHCIITCNMKNAPYCIANALCNATEGKLAQGFAFAGQNVWRVDNIVHVSELMQSLQDEYDEAEKNN